MDEQGAPSPDPQCPNGCEDAELRKLGSSVPLSQKGQPTNPGVTLYQCLECDAIFQVERKPMD